MKVKHGLLNHRQLFSKWHSCSGAPLIGNVVMFLKNMRTLIIILFISLSVCAQSTADYYPLQSGNKWFYKVTDYDVDSTPSSISYYSKEVVDDTTMGNGKKYFIILQSGHKHYERFDTSTNEIRYYELSGCPGNDIARYSLNYIKDSTIVWNSCNHMTYKINYKESELSDTSFIYLHGDGLVVEFTSFKKYIGMTGQSFTEGGYSSRVLIGSKINGKEWGQLTSVNNDNDIEFDYKLEQNYPNPFNPATTIEFTIKRNSRVRLNIYNSLGQIITTILDKELLQGQHRILFDGSNYSSGIYFYQIITDNFTKAKKFIIMK